MTHTVDTLFRHLNDVLGLQLVCVDDLGDDNQSYNIMLALPLDQPLPSGELPWDIAVSGDWLITDTLSMQNLQIHVRSSG